MPDKDERLTKVSDFFSAGVAKKYNIKGRASRDKKLKEALELAIDLGEIDVNAKGEDGEDKDCTLLYLAVRQGCAQTAKMLLKKGADLRLFKSTKLFISI